MKTNSDSEDSQSMDNNILESVEVISPWSNNLQSLQGVKTTENMLSPLAQKIYEDDPNSSYFLTINPFDYCKTSNLTVWKDMVYRAQYNYICTRVKDLVGTEKLRMIMTFELSEKGRLHAHAIISFEDKRDMFLFRQKLFLIFSSPKCPKIAVDMYPLTDSFIEIISTKQHTIGLNYLTKDVGYMLSKGFKPLVRLDEDLLKGIKSNLVRIKKPLVMKKCIDKH